MKTTTSFQQKFSKGFTLIELLLVIGIIAILASIVIVAINPTKQLGDARNAQRRSDVNTILNAVYQYAIDEDALPAGIPTSPVVAGICKSDSTDTCLNANETKLSDVIGPYIVDMPVDPQADATGTGTNYTITQDSNGRVTVSAPGAEQDAVITVTR